MYSLKKNIFINLLYIVFITLNNVYSLPTNSTEYKKDNKPQNVILTGIDQKNIDYILGEGDKEIFTIDESIKYFNLDGIGKSPSKLDMSRILSMNEHYIKNMSEDELYSQFENYCDKYKNKIPNEKSDKIIKSLKFLKNKAKTLEDIYNNSKYIIEDVVSFNLDDLKLIDDNAKKIISEFSSNIDKLDKFERNNLEPILEKLIKSNNTNFKGVGQPLRIILTGSKFGPGIYDIIISLGKEEVKKRLSAKIT